MKSNKILSNLSLLACLAILAPITGQDSWLAFLSFFTFSLFKRHKSDERLRENLNKASRNAFIVSILGWVMLIFFITNNPIVKEEIFTFIQAVIAIFTITFVVSINLYEKKPEI